jgi:hypothetical protein
MRWWWWISKKKEKKDEKIGMEKGRCKRRRQQWRKRKKGVPSSFWAIHKGL